MSKPLPLFIDEQSLAEAEGRIVIDAMPPQVVHMGFRAYPKGQTSVGGALDNPYRDFTYVRLDVLPKHLQDVIVTAIQANAAI